ncbi:hypothetical protein Tco_0405255 [Tanacetum coccineum]
MSFSSGTAFGLHPYQFTYPERRLTMEEMLYKYIDEGKREHEEMSAFIREFRTTKEPLFKERNNSLSELRFEVYGLSKVINNALISYCEAKGVTTRGGKTITQRILNDNTDIHDEGPSVFIHDKLDAPKEVLIEDEPQKAKEQVVQPSIEETTRSDEVKSEHLYSASANEIDEKKPRLKDLPHHLEYAYLHDHKSFPIIISPKLSEMEKMLLLQVRIYQKSQENSQKRASTDTRIRRVQKEAKESKPKPEKSSLTITPTNLKFKNVTNNTIPNPRNVSQGNDTRNGFSYDDHLESTRQRRKRKVRMTKDITEQTRTVDLNPPLVQEQTKDKEPIEDPSSLVQKTKTSLPYPSRLAKEKIHEKDDILCF